MKPSPRAAARVPSSQPSPGRYFPLSTPCASGDQTIWETPSSREAGMTSRSGSRWSSEYSGCEETIFA